MIVQWIISLLLNGLFGFAGMLFRSIGLPGLVVIVAGGVLALSVSSAIKRWLKTPKGMAVMAGVLVAALGFSWLAAPKLGQASPGVTGFLSAKEAAGQKKAIEHALWRKHNEQAEKELEAASRAMPMLGGGLPLMAPGLPVATPVNTHGQTPHVQPAAFHGGGGAAGPAVVVRSTQTAASASPAVFAARSTVSPSPASAASGSNAPGTTAAATAKPASATPGDTQASGTAAITPKPSTGGMTASAKTPNPGASGVTPKPTPAAPAPPPAPAMPAGPVQIYGNVRKQAARRANPSATPSPGSNAAKGNAGFPPLPSGNHGHPPAPPPRTQRYGPSPRQIAKAEALRNNAAGVRAAVEGEFNRMAAAAGVHPLTGQPMHAGTGHTAGHNPQQHSGGQHHNGAGPHPGTGQTHPGGVHRP